MIRAVVDTNVYISALVFGGKPASVIQLAELGVYLWVTSSEIKAELVETLVNKFGWPKNRAERACRELWDEAYWVMPPRDVRASRDAKDDFILACALESRADFVVTGDQDLLALHPFRGVAIVTPAVFISQVARAKPT